MHPFQLPVERKDRVQLDTSESHSCANQEDNRCDGYRKLTSFLQFQPDRLSIDHHKNKLSEYSNFSHTKKQQVWF